MGESIFSDFLEHTTRGGMDLADRSDVLDVKRLRAAGEGLFLASFQVAYLARLARGQIGVAPGPLAVMIRIGPDYLRHAEPLETVQVGNQEFFHPNYRWPVLCVGELRPGMPLATLLRHIFEIVTYQNYATDDGLDPVACARLREEPELIDRLPRPPRLLRRRLEIEHSELHVDSQPNPSARPQPERGDLER
jgi:hypothetical protein